MAESAVPKRRRLGFSEIPRRVRWIIYVNAAGGLGFGYLMIFITAYYPQIGIGPGTRPSRCSSSWGTSPAAWASRSRSSSPPSRRGRASTAARSTSRSSWSRTPSGSSSRSP